MAKSKKTQEKSILDSIYQDYGLLAQEQDPNKVAAILRRLADGMDKTGDIKLLGFTFGFTAHVEDFPRAVIDIDFLEPKLIDARRETAPEEEATNEQE